MAVGVAEAASSSLITQTKQDSFELENSSYESYFLLKKLCSMHYFVHNCMIKVKIETQKPQRELDVFYEAWFGQYQIRRTLLSCSVLHKLQ